MDEIRSGYERYAPLFGREVEVTVNRPLGSRICLKKDASRSIRCPLNSGYLTRSITPDGGETDAHYPDFQYAYIVGIDTPLTSFRGTVIAVLHREAPFGGLSGRKNAAEDTAACGDADGTAENTLPSCLSPDDRLIVAPSGAELYEPDIRNAVASSERNRHYRLFCMFEKSCGAVVYTENDGTLLYLLIRNRSGHIGFPKGHVELHEDERMTMKREIFEETGLRVEPEPDFREEYRYALWNIVRKTAVYSLAAFRYGETVETMENEIFGDWLVPYPEARQLLSYENDRRILDRADLWLRGKHSASSPVLCR